MGNAASSSGNSRNAGKIMQNAEEAKILPDKIMKWIVNNTEFRDMLDLTDISKCPYYVEEGMKLVRRQQVQQVPLIGEQKRYHDSLCLDKSFYYATLFQIFGALFLTVGEQVPFSQRTTDKFRQQQRQLRGGRKTRRKSRSQAGGRLSSSSRIEGEAKLVSEISKSPYNIFLKEYFSIFRSGYSSDSTFKGVRLYMDVPSDNGPGTFQVLWDGSESLNFIYTLKGKIENGKAPPSVDGKFKMAYKGQNTIGLYLSGDLIAVFIESVDPKNPLLYYLEGNEQAKYVRIDALAKRIHEYFRDKLPDSGTYIESSYNTSSGRATTSSTISRTSFSTTIPEFRKLFDSFYKGETRMPKAYAIARAMTLMSPLYMAERETESEPFFCNVCNMAENVGGVKEEYAMPKPGRTPRENIYLRSLVGLFYDEATLVDSTGTSVKVALRKSPSADADLKNASTLLARLYNIPSNQKREEFIESTTPFNTYGSKLCGDNYKTNRAQITDPQVIELLQKYVIGPLIKLQQEHNAQVDQLIKSMVSMNGDQISLSPILLAELNTTERIQINNFRISAREIVLHYYLKSEAFFILGILLLEKYKAGTTLRG